MIDKNFSITQLLALAALLVFMGGKPAVAEYDPGESYDGTVASIRWLDEPKPTPAFSFKDSDGGLRRLSDYSGKVLLVNLWATWCPPCLRELPSLDQLQAELGGEDFMVLPISVDRLKQPVVQSFYDKLEIRHLGLFLDPWHQSQKAFRLDTLPATYLIDRQGRILGYLRSYADWTTPEARALLDRLIAAKPS